MKATTWLDQAHKLSNAAEIAQAEGDMEAFVALITGAAQCVHIARLLERIDEGMAEMAKLPGRRG